jgi:hypothetical protein
MEDDEGLVIPTPRRLPPERPTATITPISPKGKAPINDEETLALDYANKQPDKGMLFENKFIVELDEKRKRAIYAEGQILIEKENQQENIERLNLLLESIQYNWLNLPADPKDATEFPDVCITCGKAFENIAQLTHFLHRLGFNYQVIFNRLGIVGTHSFMPCCRNSLMGILPQEANYMDYALIRGDKMLTVALQEARERFKFDPNYTYAMLYEDKKRQEQEKESTDVGGIEYIEVGCGLTVPVIKGSKMYME